MNICNKWKSILADEIKKDYYQKLLDFLETERHNYIIYPPKDEIFKAFELTDYDDVKVVILGQDPYHNYNQAHGLCFAVREGIKLPPSLKNIYQEIEADLNIRMTKNGDLTKWAKQGVLLLNTVLTVRDGCANSHKNIGWEQFTDTIIKALNQRDKPIIFLLWGLHAQSKEKLISNNKHYILKTSHPSPLSAYQGFLGCKHFSKTNEILKKINEKVINWEI